MIQTIDYVLNSCLFTSSQLSPTATNSLPTNGSLYTSTLQVHVPKIQQDRPLMSLHNACMKLSLAVNEQQASIGEINVEVMASLVSVWSSRPW